MNAKLQIKRFAGKKVKSFIRKSKKALKVTSDVSGCYYKKINSLDIHKVMP